MSTAPQHAPCSRFHPILSTTHDPSRLKLFLTSNVLVNSLFHIFNSGYLEICQDMPLNISRLTTNPTHVTCGPSDPTSLPLGRPLHLNCSTSPNRCPCISLSTKMNRSRVFVLISHVYSLPDTELPPSYLSDTAGTLLVR